jgi:hypothetical protein
MPTAPGARIGAYETLSLLGRGGMGDERPAPTQVNIVLNWLAELKRLVPSGQR